MPDFAFPPGAGGGGGGGGSLPVQGGSGTFYGTIASAILGETEDAATTFTPVAGTVAGVIVGPGTLDATDEFYKDYWVVNEDTTPTNGLQCRYARVSKYVGATRTLTIDQPWNFTSNTPLRLIRPIRIWILRDMMEDVTFTKNVEFNLEGHRLQGKIDQTVGSFCWIRDGWVTNGIQKTTLGVLRLDDLSVSRRDDSIYAVLMTEGSDLGRTVLRNCHFFGVVAGRRGRAGWEIEGCRNDGAAETNRNIPYRLFESVAGVAIVIIQANWTVNGEWSGAVFYSENSITGIVANLSGQINAKVPNLRNTTVTVDQPVRAFLYCPVGAATLTMTWAVLSYSTINIVGANAAIPTGAGGGQVFPGSPLCGFVLAIDFSGTFNVSGVSGGTIASQARLVGEGCNLTEVLVLGTTTMSGSITISNVTTIYSGLGSNFIRISLQATISGTIVDGSIATVGNVDRCVVINNTAAQTLASTVTVSGSLTASNIGFFRGLNFGNASEGGTVSSGTWTVSGIISLSGLSSLNGLVILNAETTGGTVTWSSATRIFMSSTQTQSAFFIVQSASTVSFTVSGSVFVVMGEMANMQALSSNSTGTITISGAWTLRGFVVSQASPMFNSLGNGGTTLFTGAITLEKCRFTGGLTLITAINSHTATFSGVLTLNDVFVSTATTLINSSAATAVTGPTSIALNDCTFTGALTVDSGASFVWSASTLRFRNSHVEGLLTFTGTFFTTVEAFETFFNGNSSNESITATGTRPTTYRLWKCGYRARVEDLQPEIIHEYEVRPASGALAAGQLLTINASGQAASPAAASVVEGVLLIATTALGQPAVMVRSGTIFVDSDGAVVAGDNCNLDAATPTQQVAAAAAAAGQRIGRALEATGAVRAGEAYSVVNLM